MAKIVLTIQDTADGQGAEMDIAGDFEKDISKCTPAQRMVVELLFILNSRSQEQTSECQCTDGECQSC